MIMMLVAVVIVIIEIATLINNNFNKHGNNDDDENKNAKIPWQGPRYVFMGIAASYVPPSHPVIQSKQS